MAIDFPNSPATNATYTVGNKTWIYDGTTWNTYNTTSFSAETLPGTTLKSTVTGSSLTSVGTLGSLSVTNVTTSGSFVQGTDYHSPYQGFRNKIINGDFSINQRAFTSITASDTYGFDRWAFQSSGGTSTMTPQTFTVGSPAATGYESANFCRLITSGQSGVNDYSILYQKIEDVRTFANSTITVSFWAKAASGTPKIALEFGQVFGTGGSPSSGVNTYAGQSTINTSWARYSITATVPSIASKTIGTTANTSLLGMNFWVSAGSTFNSRTGSIGIQNNTFDIWGVQVERGSVATPFEQRPIQQELALCQRYYQKSYSLATAPGTATESGQYAFYGTGNVFALLLGTTQLRVPMRVAPTTVTYYRSDATNTVGWSWFNTGGSTGTGTPTTVYASETSFTTYLSITTSYGSGGIYGNWIASAEL